MEDITVVVLTPFQCSPISEKEVDAIINVFGELNEETLTRILDV